MLRGYRVIDSSTERLSDPYSHSLRSFDVEFEYYGAARHHELLPGGSKVPVTAANRKRYVELYVEWLLSRSVEKQFSAFAHGFHQVSSRGLSLSGSDIDIDLCRSGDLHQLSSGGLDAYVRCRG